MNLRLTNLKLMNLKLINIKLMNLKLMNFKLMNLKLMNLKLMNLKLVVFLYFLVLFGTFWCLAFFLCFFVLVKSYHKKKKFKADLITSFILILSYYPQSSSIFKINNKYLLKNIGFVSRLYTTFNNFMFNN